MKKFFVLVIFGVMLVFVFVVLVGEIFIGVGVSVDFIIVKYKVNGVIGK